MNTFYYKRFHVTLFLSVVFFPLGGPSYAQLETFSVFFDYGRFGDGCLFPFEPAHPDGLTVSDLELMNVSCRAGSGHDTTDWPETPVPDPGKYLYATIVPPEGEMLSFQETDSLIINAQRIGSSSSLLATYFANGDSVALGEWAIADTTNTYAVSFDKAFTTDSIEVRLYGFNFTGVRLIIFDMRITMQATHVRVSTEEEARLDRTPHIQVYPNPVQSDAWFIVDLQTDTHAQLAVYDLLGREVQRLVDTWLPSGRHHLAWDSTNHPNGLYLYRLQVADQVIIGKVTVVR